MRGGILMRKGKPRSLLNPYRVRPRTGSVLVRNGRPISPCAASATPYRKPFRLMIKIPPRFQIQSFRESAIRKTLDFGIPCVTISQSAGRSP